MEVVILGEAGYEYALMGIGKSFGVTDKERLIHVAERLAPRDGGHNKFLESIVVWLDIKAPRYWWQEFDTYRVGTTKQSESTIHTIAKKEVTQADFSHPVLHDTVVYLNSLIELFNKTDLDKSEKETIFELIKSNLPEGYLQSRVVCTNYKVIKNIIHQRKNHVLEEWHAFIKTLLNQLEHANLLKKDFDYAR